MAESLRNQTTKGVWWSLGGSVASYGITFIVGIVLARLLSPSEYGLIGIIMVFVTVFDGVIDSGFSILDVLIAVSVGICEEMVFRGLFLNVTLREGKNNIAAVAVNSLLFLIIHFPVWYRTGTLAVNLQSGAFLALLLLSVIFSYVFVKTKSLVIPAALHTCWDLLCFMQ